jgi:predicted nucleotidyltransferase
VNPIFAAALEVQHFCRSREWRFCFIGAVAVQRWGEPRLTLDVDLTVLTGFGSEPVYIDELLGHFSARRPDAREFALEYRVVLLEGENGVPIDVSLGAIPYEERLVARASEFVLEPGTAISTCGAEDLIVLKAFAAREKDWLDIEGVLVRQKGRLDENLVWRELDPLLELKGEPGIRDRLRSLVDRCRV